MPVIPSTLEVIRYIILYIYIIWAEKHVSMHRSKVMVLNKIRHALGHKSTSANVQGHARTSLYMYHALEWDFSGQRTGIGTCLLCHVLDVRNYSFLNLCESNTSKVVTTISWKVIWVGIFLKPHLESLYINEVYCVNKFEKKTLFPTELWCVLLCKYCTSPCFSAFLFVDWCAPISILANNHTKLIVHPIYLVNLLHHSM